MVVGMKLWETQAQRLQQGYMLLDLMYHMRIIQHMQIYMLRGDGNNMNDVTLGTILALIAAITAI